MPVAVLPPETLPGLTVTDCSAAAGGGCGLTVSVADALLRPDARGDRHRGAGRRVRGADGEAAGGLGAGHGDGGGDARHGRVAAVQVHGRAARRGREPTARPSRTSRWCRWSSPGSARPTTQFPAGRSAAGVSPTPHGSAAVIVTSVTAVTVPVVMLTLATVRPPGSRRWRAPGPSDGVAAGQADRHAARWRRVVQVRLHGHAAPAGHLAGNRFTLLQRRCRVGGHGDRHRHRRRADRRGELRAGLMR